MLRRYRFAARPGWVALHLLVLALVVTMILLGRWQLIVSDEKHFSLQNFGYAIQWWLFSLFAVILWARVLRDRVRRQSGEQPSRPEPEARAAEPVEYRRYVMPTTPQESSDPVHAAYNDYLAKLAAQDEERQ